MNNGQVNLSVKNLFMNNRPSSSVTGVDLVLTEHQHIQ